MLQHDLDLPTRSEKPRTSGLTMIIDNGLPNGEFADVMVCSGDYVDYVKFGWGTALVSRCLDEKMAVLRELGIPFYFGGTLFEKHIQQNRFEEFVALLKRAGVETVEVSNGTIDMTNEEKCSWIRKLSGDFQVLSEVGFKQSDNDSKMSASDWAEWVQQDLASGSTHVITEARESGTSGIASANGKPKDDVVEAVLAVAPAEKLIFEAPTKALQTHLITKIGSEVNLGNIAPRDLISVETLRLGLRSDTFFAFE